MNRHPARQVLLAMGIATLLAAFQSSANAGDGTVARLVGMQGNVLVSRDASLASAGETARLAPGSRVLTTPNSSVVVEYDDGCRVKLGHSQRLEVAAQAPCTALAAERVREQAARS